MSKDINQRVHDVAGILEKSMTVGEGGVVEVPEDLFEQTLEGTDLTMDTIRAVQTHHTEVYAGLGLALGRKGIGAFKDNDKLENVSVSLPVGKDNMNMNFQKTRAVPDGKGGMKDRPGVLTGSYAAFCSGNKGQLKLVKNHLSELIQEEVTNG